MPSDGEGKYHPTKWQDSSRRQQLPSSKGVEVIDCDILIIGAGAAGLAAAAAVQNKGLRVILVEKEKHVGGTTFKSGGCVWMPNNFLMREYGIDDSKKQGALYINAVRWATSQTPHGDTAHDTIFARRLDAFLTRGPEMVDYFRGQGFRWMTTLSKLPDYHTNLEGAVERGRTIDPVVFDAKSLGNWEEYLPLPDGAPLIPRFERIRALTTPPLSRSRYGRLSTVPIGVSRPVSMGRSLVTQLLRLCQIHGNVSIWTSYELHELLLSDSDDGGVTGARVRYRREISIDEDNDHYIDIQASLGVVLTTGGFSRNQHMRDACIGTSTWKSKAAWSLAADSDTGVALDVSQRVDAGTAQLDQVWGIPTMIDPGTEKTTEAMFAIAKPFSIVVDGTGRRFFSESEPYGDAVAAMYDRARLGAEPAAFWLVFDQTYVQRYPIGSLRPIKAHEVILQGAVDRGRILCSNTLDGLEEQMQVPGNNLRLTIDMWNNMCEHGVDELFGRGNSGYQKFMGDPNVGPNPCMGAIRRGPFYAINIFPGDAGTRGGLWTDELARVLRADGQVVRNLFAAGNAVAALLGTHGAGSLIAPAMTDAFIAVKYMESLASMERQCGLFSP